MQKAKGNCLVDGYVSFLPERVHVDLKQNKFTELTDIWEHISGPNKRKFCDRYGQITSLIAVVSTYSSGSGRYLRWMESSPIRLSGCDWTPENLNLFNKF